MGDLVEIMLDFYKNKMISSIKAVAKKILPKCLIRILKIIQKTYCNSKNNVLKYFIKYDFIEKEHIKHFGIDFPDIIFYVIRRFPPGAGLLSNYHWVLGHVAYAISKHYIPVVNMENYKTYYNENTTLEVIDGGGGYLMPGNIFLNNPVDTHLLI